MTASRLVSLVAAALAALFALIVIVFMARRGFPYAHDDAFITFTYARNLAEGHGLVFNPGERVWGYTSPLHTLLLGLFTWAGLDTAAACYSLSLGAIGTTGWLLFQVARRFLFAPLALICSVAFLSFANGVYLGLESDLLVMLQAIFLLAILRGRHGLAAAAGALSCLARPDSVLLVAPAFLLVRDMRTPRNLSLFILPGLLWVGFAWLYYGEILPNSLSAKQGLTSFTRYWAYYWKLFTSPELFRQFIRPVLGQGWQTAWPASIATLGLALVLLADPRLRRARYLPFALLAYPALALFSYSLIGSFMVHRWELASAHKMYTFAWALGLARAIQLLAGRLFRGRPSAPAWRRRAVLPCLLLSMFLFDHNVRGCFQRIKRCWGHKWGGVRHQEYLRVARWINANIPPGSTILANEVGTLGYFTRQHWIDAAGIITPAHKPGERMSLLAFAHRHKPDYLLFLYKSARLALGPGLRYRRIKFFPDRGFSQMTLMRRVVPADSISRYFRNLTEQPYGFVLAGRGLSPFFTARMAAATRLRGLSLSPYGSSSMAPR